MGNLRSTEPDSLTPREVDVVGLAADGHTNRQIARELHIGGPLLRATWSTSTESSVWTIGPAP